MKLKKTKWVIFFVLLFSFSAHSTSLFVDPAGNVGIGTEHPLSKLHIRSQMSPLTEMTTLLRLENYSSAVSAGTGQSIEFFNNYASGSSPRAGIEMRYSENRVDKAGLVFRTRNKQTYTEALSLWYNGNVGISQSTPSYKLDVNGTIRGENVSPSDVRWKTNIQPIENALEKVSQLRGVNYEWTDPAKGIGNQIGVIAQEVEEVFPEAVSTDNQGYKSVAYAKLVGPLIEAVKELKQENKELKDQIQKLNAVVNNLSQKEGIK